MGMNQAKKWRKINGIWEKEENGRNENKWLIKETKSKAVPKMAFEISTENEQFLFNTIKEKRKSDPVRLKVLSAVALKRCLTMS